MTNESEFDAIQKAILWSGSALIVGALLGFGIGVSLSRDYFRKKGCLR